MLRFVVLAMFLAACGGEARGETCELTVGPEIARSSAGIFDAIDATLHEGDLVVLYSEPNGTYLATRHGGAFTTHRVAPRLEGGVAIASTPSGLAWAGIERPVAEMDKSGLVVVVHAGRRAIVPAIGATSGGIDIEAKGDGVVVAFQDSDVGHNRVMELSPGSDAPRVLSRVHRAASRPFLLRSEDRVLTTWDEATFDEERRASSEIMIDRGTGAPRSVRETKMAGAWPSLVTTDLGTILAYRDSIPRGERAHLFVQRVDRRGETLGEPVKLGRADAESPPSLVACEGGVVSASPRSYGKSTIVGVQWTAASLESHTIEHHFYAQGVELAHVVVVCDAEHATLVAAETANEAARLRTGTFECGDAR